MWTESVADFIGQSNFLPGTVTGTRASDDHVVGTAAGTVAKRASASIEYSLVRARGWVTMLGDAYVCLTPHAAGGCAGPPTTAHRAMPRF